MGLEQALEQLPIGKKARRLRVLWPLIEAKLAEGVSHAAVLDFLNRNGFDLTEGPRRLPIRASARPHSTMTREGFPIY